MIRNIWAVGRNYADHAREMKAEIPKSPMIFLKAGSCVETGSKIKIPAWSKDVHHELELAYWIDENLKLSHVSLALDLTARDAQAEAKAKGQPWTSAKSFTGACPLGSWVSLADIDTQEELQFQLIKNNEIVQSGYARDMIFNPEILLQHIKNHFPVMPSDLLLTGTPAGVASLKSGDVLQARLTAANRELLTCHWDVE
ncbi:MAG: fumarylacetoacetate hydrolase family protein [Bdellovibrionaceae bacterium]|nr:fumarylacetoacetate hydrolase family protein [Bdellovibrio sp.]